MKKMSYVASWLVLTLLVGFTPSFAADTPHVEGGPVAEGARPPADENLLQEKKYTLLTDKVFADSFKTKVKDLDGVEKADQEIKASDIGDIKKFLEMSKNLRVTMQACFDKRDDSADYFKKVMDSSMQFLVSSVFDETAEKLKEEKDRVVEAKHLSTYIWAAEAYFKAQAKKFSSEKMDEWNVNYLEAAKKAFKALTKTEYSLDKWKAKRAGLLAAEKTQADKDLAQVIKDADEAIKKLKDSEEACLVKPKDTDPTPSTSPSPSTSPAPSPSPSPSPSTTAKIDTGNGGPLQGGNGEVKPSPTPGGPAPTTPPLTDITQNLPPGVDIPASAETPVELDNIFRRLGDDFNNQAQQQVDDLNRQRQQLEDALANLERANRDQQALLDDEDNNDAALADALRALGDKNQEQPVIPPPITPPQIASGDQGGGQETPQFTPPPQEEEPQQPPFNPYAMGPQPLPPTPIIVAPKDKDKENPFADLVPQKQPLPTVSDSQAAVAAMKDLIASQRDQIAMMRGGRPGGPQNINNIASRMGGGFGSMRGIPARRPINGNAKSGKQNQLSKAPNARTSVLPASMQSRIR